MSARAERVGSLRLMGVILAMLLVPGCHGVQCVRHLEKLHCIGPFRRAAHRLCRSCG